MAVDPADLGEGEPGRPRVAARVPWRRAFAGVSGRRLGMLLAFCIVWAVSLQLNILEDAWQHSRLLPWLVRHVGSDFGCVLAIALIGGAPIVVAFNLGPSRGLQRVVVLSAAVACAGLAGILVRYNYMLTFNGGGAELNFRNGTLWFTRYGILAAALAVVIELRHSESRSLGDLHAAEMDRLALDREMAEARLQVLQAQIEPHFLFNTLATVRRLYLTDAAAGARMLGNLMRYVEIALPQMRARDSTLGREIDLVEAYLALHGVRMGARLAYRIDVPESLRAIVLPPMMIITLVENAIKHGLNALPEGGVVRIAASVDEPGRLRIEVADDGAGFQHAAGNGTGLANIRARLGALYGAAARLDLDDNRPRGVVSTIRMPCVPA